MTEAREGARPGTLTIVGTGISVGHLTAESRSWIAHADKVLYCVADAPTERLILKLNVSAESLYPFYGEGKKRKETYEQMVERTMECVRAGQNVCVAYYGHPGIFVYPSHKAIELARSEGFRARMLPAISSIDCLFCDLGFDPSGGCQIFEATDLMLRKRAPDTSSHVIILQVSALGDMAYSFKGYDSRNVWSLGEFLCRFYPKDFRIKAYEAAQYSVCDSEIQELTVADLLTRKLNGISTLYLPPVSALPVHLEILEQYDLTSLLDGVRLVPAKVAAESN